MDLFNLLLEMGKMSNLTYEEMLLISNKVRVQLRINYNENNLNDIYALIEYISKEFVTNEYLSVYAKRIMGESMDNSTTFSFDTDKLILLKMAECGLISNILNSLTRRYQSCAATSLNTYMIHPGGEVGKCSQAMAQGCFVGDVNNGISHTKESKWCASYLDKKCLECKILPLCGGGCEYERLRNKNLVPGVPS